MSDDLIEGIRLCEPLDLRHVNRLISEGVPPMAIFRTWSGGRSPLLQARIVPLPPARFEFEALMQGETGAAAMFVAAHDEFGKVHDIIAWLGAFIGSWLGRAALMGEERFSEFRVAEHVQVHETPLEWLRASRQGVVVVDEARAGELLRPVRMVAASVQHGRHLQKMCTPPAPRISVPAPQRRAAA